MTKDQLIDAIVKKGSMLRGKRFLNFLAEVDSYVKITGKTLDQQPIEVIQNFHDKLCS